MLSQRKIFNLAALLVLTISPLLFCNTKKKKQHNLTSRSTKTQQSKQKKYKVYTIKLGNLAINPTVRVVKPLKTPLFSLKKRRN